MTAKLVKIKDETKWICTCGSKLEALYTKKREFAKSGEDRVCAWCFKESGKPSHKTGRKNGK